MTKMTVRIKLPVRRIQPSRNPTGRNWSEHKPDLREDFHKYCGYCGSYDGFRHTYFEVDHFVPKVLFEIRGNISYCQYDNLVYSCKFCNNNKLSKWPSNDELVCNVNNEGFVDPCDVNFDSHLYRTETGSIRWSTDLGKWMVEKGFKFDERDYSIKLLWTVDRLRIAVNTLVAESKKYSSDSDHHKEIMANAGKYALELALVSNELRDFYDSI